MASNSGRGRGLESRLKDLEERLARIEGLLRSQEVQMDEVRSLFAFFRGSLRFYDEVSHLLSYLSSFKRAQTQEWIRSDPVAKSIILSLARRGPRNISELTRDVREDRGTASRRIITQRVDRLIEAGVVRERQEGRSRRLELGESRGPEGKRREGRK